MWRGNNWLPSNISLNNLITIEAMQLHAVRSSWLMKKENFMNFKGTEGSWLRIQGLCWVFFLLKMCSGNTWYTVFECKLHCILRVKVKSQRQISIVHYHFLRLLIIILSQVVLIYTMTETEVKKEKDYNWFIEFAFIGMNFIITIQ